MFWAQVLNDCSTVKLRFITRTGTQNLFMTEIQYFPRVVNGDGEVSRLAVCKLYPAKYGLPGLRGTKHVMSASLSARGELDADAS